MGSTREWAADTMRTDICPPRQIACSGPPGQASLYFNDPSGNHLEVTTMGYTGDIEVGAPRMSRLSYAYGS